MLNYDSRNVDDRAAHVVHFTAPVYTPAFPLPSSD